MGIDQEAITGGLLSSENVLDTQGWNERIDELELAMCESPDIFELDIEHGFTPGVYRRTLRAPAGTLATTYIHNTEHPFVVTKGVIAVLTEETGEWVYVQAPHIGVTKAGTRRVCFVFEEAEWTTFHSTNLTDVEAIEKEIFSYRILPDGTNIKDRAKMAIEMKKLNENKNKELSQ